VHLNLYLKSEFENFELENNIEITKEKELRKKKKKRKAKRGRNLCPVPLLDTRAPSPPFLPARLCCTASGDRSSSTASRCRHRHVGPIVQTDLLAPGVAGRRPHAWWIPGSNFVHRAPIPTSFRISRVPVPLQLHEPIVTQLSCGSCTMVIFSCETEHLGRAGNLGNHRHDRAHVAV
jgi:hypothetical protein